MSLSQDLARFLEDRIKEPGINDRGVLAEETELLTSNLISSLTLLELAVWIEGRMATPIDLKTIDPVKDWNTMRDILCFIKKHSISEKL